MHVFYTFVHSLNHIYAHLRNDRKIKCRMFVCNILQMKPLQTTDITTIETLIDQHLVMGLREAHISHLNKCKYIFNCKYKPFGKYIYIK